MRLRVALAITLFLLPVATVAQVGTSGISGAVCIQPDYEYELYGDHCPGERLSGATLSLVHRSPAGDVVLDETTSDKEGRFTFAEVADGSYYIRATRAGFTATEVAVTAPTKGDLAIVLKGATVTQQFDVRNDKGALAGATIHVCCRAPDYNQKIATTDTQGKASLSFIAGYYSITVEANGHYTSNGHYQLLDGQAAIEVAMERLPPPDAMLTGKVVDQNGKPVADARIQANSWNNEPRPMPAEKTSTAGDEEPARIAPAYYNHRSNTTTSGADGSFRLGVYAGEVNLNLQKEGHASVYRTIKVVRGEDQELTLELPKFPEKTALLKGRVVDERGKAVTDANLNLQSPRFGLHACSQRSDQRTPESAPAASEDAAVSSTIVAPGYYPGCDIKMNGDGTFEGKLTPGYTILRVHHDYWSACYADGREPSGMCEPKYLTYVKTMDLPANQTTTLEIVLRSRSAPDAVLQGYLLDDAKKSGIAAGSLQFYHLEGSGWGTAKVDSEGSFKVALRSGPHQVSAYADGYLQWEGIVDVNAGENRLDIRMRAGSSAYGHCCYYAYESPVSSDASASSREKAPAGSGATTPAPGAMSEAGSVGQGANAIQYDDLGGGLGPYNEAEAPGTTKGDDKGAPGLPVAVLALVGLVVALRRRN